MERDYDYEKNNIAYDHQYRIETGGGIKCKNYEVCESVLPEWWFDCKGHYLCINCDIMFGYWKGSKGVLQITDNTECPICIEKKRCISQPNCQHVVCIDCFKRCYYKQEERCPIKFPYSKQIEEEYVEDDENPKWETEYPLIKIYIQEYDKWLDEIDKKYESEEYLKKCPLCRN